MREFGEFHADDYGAWPQRLQPVGAICRASQKRFGPNKDHLVPDSIANAFVISTSIAIGVVIVELGVISWIRHRYMDTPWPSAVFQVVVGGVLVFLTGVLIGTG